MSSATSIEQPRGGDAELHPTAHSPRGGDPGLTPLQFFLLAGMLSATGGVLIVTGQSPASIIVLSLTVIAASLVALGAYRAFSPLVLPDNVAVPQTVIGRTRAALEREKTLVLRSIKELEFDFAMKKIAKADFDDLGGRLRARAIGLMRQLDEGTTYRTEIERELQNRLGTPAIQPTAPKCSCGASNDPDARFCKHCGKKLAEGAQGTEGVEEGSD